MKTATEWTDSDTAKAKRIWREYQETHDVKHLKGQAAGIDPESGEVWFGDSALDAVRKMREDGVDRPLFFERVGYGTYLRKGGRR